MDVRLIAATNQDLDACMQRGAFRADLFYRLSVFPIRLCPLRERRDDIALLTAHFMRRFAARLHKPVPRVSPEVMRRLMAYDWPGNIRELQNVVERAVILTQGPVIGLDVIAVQQRSEPRAAEPIQPSEQRPLPPNVIRFTDAERHAILHALELAGWRISGRGGAAESLGLKPTTLHAKMKKLGIRRPTAADEAPRMVRA